MEFKGKYMTPNKYNGLNSCKFIILHHTGGGLKSAITTFTTPHTGKSAHFVIDVNGDKYKIGTPEEVLFHAGESKRGNLKSLNWHSIGIEVVGPIEYGFDDRQRKSVKELMIHLMKIYGIPKENILRHKDIAPGRKVDIDDRFWNNEFKSWNDWKNAKLILS